MVPDPPRWSFHPRFPSIDEWCYVFGSVGSKNPRAAENSDKSQVLPTPGSGAHLDRSQEQEVWKECPASPGTRAEIKIHEYWGPKTAHTPLHGHHAWWIQIFKVGNRADINCYTSVIPNWHTRKVPQILAVNLFIHKGEGTLLVKGILWKTHTLKGHHSPL